MNSQIIAIKAITKLANHIKLMALNTTPRNIVNLANKALPHGMDQNFMARKLQMEKFII